MVARISIPGSTSVFHFTVNGCSDDMRVVQFSGTEGMSSPFEFHLKLACENHSLDFSDVVGKTALLTLLGERAPRFVHGIVCRFEQVNELHRHAIYHATLVPQLWRLRHRHDCRIFQDLKTQDILKKVFESAGIASDHFRFSLTSTYEPRDYCVQYRESDLGLRQPADGRGRHLLFLRAPVRTNTSWSWGTARRPASPSPGANCCPSGAPRASSSTRSMSQRFRFTEEIRTRKVSLRDYNFKKPDLSMHADGKAPRGCGPRGV